MDLTRSELERVVRSVIERCRGPVEQALRDAGVTPPQIDRIIFVGGPTRMPVVRGFFEDMCGRKAELGVDPMECVASGAAIQAGVLSGELGHDIVLVDVTPLTLGIETLGAVATPLIARNTPIPTRHAETFTTAADMQTSVTVHVFPGRTPDGAGQREPRRIQPGWPGAGAARHPQDRGDFRHRCNGILNVTAKDSATGKNPVDPHLRHHPPGGERKAAHDPGGGTLRGG